MGNSTDLLLIIVASICFAYLIFLVYTCRKMEPFGKWKIKRCGIFWLFLTALIEEALCWLPRPASQTRFISDVFCCKLSYLVMIFLHHVMQKNVGEDLKIHLVAVDMYTVLTEALK